MVSGVCFFLFLMSVMFWEYFRLVSHTLTPSTLWRLKALSYCEVVSGDHKGERGVLDDWLLGTETWSLSAENRSSLKTSVVSNPTMNGATPSSGRITWPITWPTSTFRAHSVGRSVYTAGNLPALPLLLCLWFHSKFQSHRHASICLQPGI